MRYLYYSIWLSIAISFLCIYSVGNTQTITTGNLLPNANDGVDWNSSSTDMINDGGSGFVSNGANVNGFTITCPTGQANCGYKYDVGGDFEVTGTATVSASDVKLYSNTITQPMLDNGITLNSHVDVANCESTQGNCESKGGANDSHTTTVVLKDNSGNTLSTVSQTRTEVTGFQGNCNGYPGSSGSVAQACGQYNDRIIYLGLGANNVDWSWTGTDSNYSNQSRQGPNLLGASLNMTYNNVEFNPIDENTQDDIEDINEDIIDIVENIPDDFDWNTDDLYFEDDIIIIEDDFTFDDTFTFEEIYIDELPPIEEFDMEVFEEIPEMEMVFFEEEFSEPMMVTEEIFTEEFEEDFTEFLEETGMEEEFMEFLEEEGITAEEFFEEITEEEFNDELTEESFEEFEEPLEDITTEEESLSEVEENETETVEDVTESDEVEEEKEVAKNETEEEKPDSTESEESDVSTEESGEQEDIQSEEVNADTEVVKDIAATETKLKKNLKTIAKQIAKVTKETTNNLSKEDIFFKGNDLDSYSEIVFYTAKEIYDNTNMGFFLQIDLSTYSGEIYVNTSLSSYTDNDPVEIHRVKLLDINKKKNKILAELEALKK
mgnify:CR=1 FL=1